MLDVRRQRETTVPVVPLKSPLKPLREKLGLPVPAVAKMLGVDVPEYLRWEKSLAKVSDAHLRDLAILFELNVSALTGVKPPEEGLSDWPFAVEEVSEHAPYGTLRVGFEWGVREYPIDERVRSRLLEQIGQFDVQGEDQRTSWLHTWAMDNRLLYFNLDYVDWIDLISDDEEAMPSFEHPEVYFALETMDVSERENGPILEAALQRVLDQHESLDDAIRPVRHSLTITKRGREIWHHMLEAADSMAHFILGLTHDMRMSRNALLEMSSEGYYAARHINLSRVAVIEFPAEQYARLSREID